jgi:diaminohydroxyphosphoribosylaminopyrimidine deaminase / 5-amino-6-(5-phosphoribosylamino)uracil reductase
MQAADERWMSRALELAKNGLGLTHPNPPVGAVIINAAGELVAEGWHRQAGGPHAEADALANATGPVSGGTAYVSLEPCTTHGRTPPCALALVNAGIRRVVWSIDDPNPLHSGAAAAFFRQNGISTQTGVLHAEGTELLRPWSTFITQDRPYVIVKSAISLDGKLTRPAGESQWLSCPESRAEIMLLRAASDAILIGGNTLRNDDPSLTVRPASLLPTGKPQPWRVIWTRLGTTLPAQSQLFTDDHAERTLAISHATPEAMLSHLKSMGVVQLIVEGGSQVITSLLTAQCVDELQLYLSPLISGGGLPFINPDLWGKTGSQAWKLKETRRIQDDVKLIYRSSRA